MDVLNINFFFALKRFKEVFFQKLLIKNQKHYQIRMLNKMFKKKNMLLLFSFKETMIKKLTKQIQASGGTKPIQ